MTIEEFALAVMPTAGTDGPKIIARLVQNGILPTSKSGEIDSMMVTHWQRSNVYLVEVEKIRKQIKADAAAAREAELAKYASPNLKNRAAVLKRMGIEG